MMQQSTPECELCQAAITWFEREGWRCHQEVELPGVAQRTRKVDLILEQDGEYRAVEAKTSLNATVIKQAASVRQWAHRVYVLVPAATSKSSRDNRDMFLKIALAMGIGVLELTETGIRVRLAPEFNAQADTSVITLRLALHTPGAAAGSPTRAAPGRGQDRWDALRDHLAGCGKEGASVAALRSLLDLTKPEWNAMVRMGRRGEIRGVRHREVRGMTWLYLEAGHA